MTTGRSGFYPYRGVELYNSANSVSYLLEIGFIFSLPALEFILIFFNHFRRKSAWKMLVQSGCISFQKNPETTFN